MDPVEKNYQLWTRPLWPPEEAAPFILNFRRARPKMVFLGARYLGNNGAGDLSVGSFHTVWVGAK